MSAELVATIKADLEARGVIPNPQTDNSHSFAITARVAYALRHEGAKLIVKRPEQNGCVYNGVKYSHDAIALQTGWIDCLASAGPPDNSNRPVWQAIDKSDAALAEPFDLDAGGVEPPHEPPVDPPDEPPAAPPSDIMAVLGVAITLLNKQSANVTDLREDLKTLVGMLTLSEVAHASRYALVEDALRALKTQYAKGLSGTVFGARVSLKPPA